MQTPTRTRPVRQLREVPPTAPSAGTGPRTQRELTGERTYFCRSCLAVKRGRWVPTGWYALERSVGGGGKSRWLGLYCSVPCLMGAEQTLIDGEAAHNRLIGLTEQPGRARDRLLMLARTLLYEAQMTLRQVGDELDVPTEALRKLLEYNGIEIPVPPAPTRAAKPLVIDPDKPALETVNELRQAGYLSQMAWTIDKAGPPHNPVFTAQVSAQARTPDGGYRPVAAKADAATKNGARIAAAAALLDALAAEYQPDKKHSRSSTTVP